MTQQKDSFLATLDQFESRYDQIENEIAQSASSGHTSLLVALSKEQGKLRDIVAKYREYKTITSDIDDAEQIIADDTVDADFKALAKE
jgi:peptide chain release factor 1